LIKMKDRKKVRGILRFMVAFYNNSTSTRLGNWVIINFIYNNSTSTRLGNWVVINLIYNNSTSARLGNWVVINLIYNNSTSARLHAITTLFKLTTKIIPLRGL
jgi:hypothetical protein